MKKASNKARGNATDEMPDEYPPGFFKSGVRGKYYAQYMREQRPVRIAPDLAEDFPNAETVNEALRMVQQIRRSGRTLRRKSA